jgi:hypothetical protein
VPRWFAAFRRPRAFVEQRCQAVTLHLFSRDAEWCRERLSWRCVGRRREEPAARRRATNGPIRNLRGSVFRAPAEVHEAPRRASSIVGSATVDLGRSVCRTLFRRAPPGSHGHRLRHSSKPCNPRVKDDCIETAASPRATSSREPLLCLVQSRGLYRPVASLADFRQTRVENARVHMEPPRLQR